LNREDAQLHHNMIAHPVILMSRWVGPWCKRCNGMTESEVVRDDNNDDDDDDNDVLFEVLVIIVDKSVELAKKIRKRPNKVRSRLFSCLVRIDKSPMGITK